MASVCGATLGLMAAGVPITNPVAGIVHLAFDFQVISFHPRQETGQAGHFVTLIGERLAEQGIDAVLGFVTQPCEKFPAAVMPCQNPLDQVGSHALGVELVGCLASSCTRFTSLAGATGAHTWSLAV